MREKNVLGEFNIGLDTTEEKISEFEVTGIKTIKNDIRREKRLEKN